MHSPRSPKVSVAEPGRGPRSWTPGPDTPTSDSRSQLEGLSTFKAHLNHTASPQTPCKHTHFVFIPLTFSVSLLTMPLSPA